MIQAMVMTAEGIRGGNMMKIILWLSPSPTYIFGLLEPPIVDDPFDVTSVDDFLHMWDGCWLLVKTCKVKE